MSIDSKIEMKEGVENLKRRFGAAAKYYPVIVVDESGNKSPALFTSDQIRIAIGRAQVNPEDVPAEGGILSTLFGFLK